MTNTDRADALFAEGYNCSQSVFAAFAEKMGMERETALKIASGFGGGMGKTGGTCGAVTGAFMVIGLARGYSASDATTEKDASYDRIRKAADRFIAIHGILSCPGLLNVDIGTPDGMADARARGVFKALCPRFVHDAAEIVETIIAED